MTDDDIEKLKEPNNYGQILAIKCNKCVVTSIAFDTADVPGDPDDTSTPDKPGDTSTPDKPGDTSTPDSSSVVLDLKKDDIDVANNIYKIRKALVPNLKAGDVLSITVSEANGEADKDNTIVIQHAGFGDIGKKYSNCLIAKSGQTVKYTFTDADMKLIEENADEWGQVLMIKGNSCTIASISVSSSAASGTPDESDPTPSKPDESDPTPSKPDESDSASSTPDESDSASSTPTESGEDDSSASNSANNGSDNNPATGISLAVIPVFAVASAAIIVVSKKRF